MDLRASTTSNTDEGEWYAPTFGGNSELPEEKRAEVKIHRASTSDMRAIRRSVRIKPNRDEQRAAEDRGEAIVRATLERRISGFRGPWSAEDAEGKKTPVSTVAELLAAVERMPATLGTALVSELFTAITEGAEPEEEERGN